jgi:UDP-N-acetyl-D-mannosaminuronic acid dehydrogenase
VGGHCISVDPWFLVEKAPDITPLIRTARQVNDSQPEFVLQTVKRLLPDLRGKKVAALGLAFKPDVDDLRESPAVEVAHLLVKSGAVVTACEPFRPDFVIEGVTVTGSLEEALRDAEFIVLLVGHAQFKALDPVTVAGMTPTRLVLDLVNGFSRAAWEDTGFTLERLGDRKNSKL